MNDGNGYQSGVSIGCAGWCIRPEHAGLFGDAGTHLSRYASRLNAVEINSSFYRGHRRTTYARWAASVREGFRFSVKMPREITHDRHLIGAEDELARFLDEAGGLGDKLGPLLVQLPPSLELDEKCAGRFFGALRRRFPGEVACEPRHRTWFEAGADTLLACYQVARVAADPAPAPEAEKPGGWPGLIYYRLHGSPQMYTSSYSDDALETIASAIQAVAARAWCVFDNTKYGAAAINALRLGERLGAASHPQPRSEHASLSL